MKTFKPVYAYIVALIVMTIAVQTRSSLEKKRFLKEHTANIETLLNSVDFYRTADSMSAAGVGVLTMKINEYEAHRATDLKLIETLRTKNRELKAAITTQTITRTDIATTVKDSIVLRYNEIDTVQCIAVVEPWYEIHGCIDPDTREFVGYQLSRDSLLIAHTIKYKRFLRVLWKTRRIKDRKVDVVSRNPNTEILDFEYIEIAN